MRPKLTRAQLERVRPGDGTLTPDEETVMHLMSDAFKAGKIADGDALPSSGIALALGWNEERARDAMQGLVELGFFEQADPAVYALQQRRRIMGEPAKEALN
jgi:hypothetical protein